MLSKKTVQNIHKNRKYHIGFLVFCPILLGTYSIYLNDWYFFFLFTKLLFIAAIHEIIHYAIAKYYGWDGHFKMTARTAYQPAIHLNPKGIFFSKEYTMIAFGPFIPSMLLGYLLADWIGLVLAGIMSCFDLWAINYHKKQEQSILDSIQITFPNEYTRQAYS